MKLLFRNSVLSFGFIDFLVWVSFIRNYNIKFIEHRPETICIVMRKFSSAIFFWKCQVLFALNGSSWYRWLPINGNNCFFSKVMVSKKGNGNDRKIYKIFNLQSVSMLKWPRGRSVCILTFPINLINFVFYL